MLNLRNVLQLVNHRFNNGSSPQEQLICPVHQAIFHVPFEFSHQVNAPVLLELKGEFLGDIAPVAKHLAKEPLQPLGHRLTVIDIAGCEDRVEQLALLIDHQVQLKPKEPVHRRFASSG